MRFDQLVPHAGASLLALMAFLAVTLSCRRMDAEGAQLFRRAAIVQGFPVVVGVLLSSLQQHRLDLIYTGYGTFFAPFALFGLLPNGSGRGRS